MDVIAEQVTSRRGGLDLAAIPKKLLLESLPIIASRNALSDKFVMSCLGEETSELALPGAYHLRKFTLAQIPSNCPSLVSLDLRKCKQTDNRIVQRAFECCTYLEFLNLSGCVRITDGAFSSILFTPLRFLNLSGCSQVTSSAVIALLLHFDRLESLNVSHTKMTNSVLWSVFDAAVTDRLREVDISGCLLLNSDDAFLDYPIRSLPLRSVKMAVSSGAQRTYTDRGAEAICKLCGPNLEEVNFAWCAALTDFSAFSLAQNCKNLKITNFTNSKISSAGVCALAAECRNLEILSLAWVTRINSKALEALGSLSLLHLDLSNCTDYLCDEGAQFSEVAIRRLLVSLAPKIESIDFGSVPALCPSAGILREIGNCVKLKNLSLSLGLRPTDDQWMRD